jgi:two-component system sensor histidine kinase BaeS
MKRGLRFRLALTHLAIAALAIVVVGVIVVYTGSRRFDSYLEQVQTNRNEAVVTSLQSTYRPPDGWDATAIYALSQVATFNNVDVAVYDTDGRLLFTVQGRHLGPGALGQGQGGGQGMMGGNDQGIAGGASSAASASPQATPLGHANFVVQSASIVVDGQQVASAEIYAPRGARAAAEESYQSALTRNLIIAAAIAGVLALLVSLLVSRRITGPLEELTDAAGDVSAGNLDVRVAPRGDDEVAALAAAFNAMADRLARDEQWRRDMTSDLSHELRTPLATIQSRVEALEDGVLPPTPENLRVIGEEVERLGRLLGALRSLNELESEDLSVQHEPVDLAEVAAAAADRHRPAFAAKGVELAEDLRAGVVLGDSDRLLQVVGNLLDNALKFTPGGGHVVVAVDTVDRPDQPAGGVPGDSTARPFVGPTGAAVRLTVTDDGPGIDPIDVPFIFDRFYRAQETRGTSGAGLGLAICRALVEAQGGSVAAGETQGGGARFTVLLPPAARN